MQLIPVFLLGESHGQRSLEGYNAWGRKELDMSERLHYFHLASSGGSEVKASACNAGETWVQSLGQEDPLEKEMATHSSTLAWRISWMEEPGGLQSIGSQRVGHN